MAITIRNTPSDFVPVNNNVIWTGSSTNDAQPQFKYLVDIYINAVQVYRYKIKAEPTTGNSLLVVDVSKILRNYVSQNLYIETFTRGIIDGNESFTEYEIQIGEEYEVAGVLTQFPNLANATSYVFNGALSYTDFVDFNPSTYLDSKFLTDAPRTQNTILAGHGALHLMLDVGTTLTDLTIKTYQSGVLFQTYQVTTALLATNYYIFASGVDSINDISPSNYVGTPVLPPITSSITSYTVEATLSAGTTEIFTYNIVDTCNEPIRVHWLNRLGGYDYFDFELSSKDRYEVQREQMKQVPDVVTVPGIVRYSKRDRQNLDYWVKEKRITKLTSNWITGAQSEWLKDMLSSQDIYLEIDGAFNAVNIQQSSYDVKYEDRDELFNLEIDFSYAIDSDRQQF